MFALRHLKDITPLEALVDNRGADYIMNIFCAKQLSL